MKGKLLVFNLLLLAMFGMANTANAYNITIGSITNGTVVADKAQAAIGETVTLTVTPASGYELGTLTVNAGYEVQGGGGGARAPKHIRTSQGNITVNKVDDTHYTFVLPEELPSILTPNYTENTDFLVTATFTEIPVTKYAITIGSMTNGTVVADKAQAAIGETVTLTVTPASGYELGTLTVNAGYEVQGGGGGARAPKHIRTSQGNITVNKVDDTHYTFVLPEELPSILTPNYTENTDFLVTATFTEIPVTKYAITIGSMTNGTVVADKTQAAIGETVTLTVTPASGYELGTLTVNAGYEVQGGGGGARAPKHIRTSQGNITVNKVDDTHYTFVLPEELPSILTPNYTENTDFLVTATFTEIPVTKHAITIATEVDNGAVVADKDQAAIGETVTLTVVPDVGYELESLTVTARYEVQGGNGGGRAPRKVYVSQGNIDVTKVDEYTYTFVVPETVKDTFGDDVPLGDNTQFNITAVFKEAVVTGIDDINATVAKTGQRYNLQGQPVGKDYKGIVVEDGKKILVK